MYCTFSTKVEPLTSSIKHILTCAFIVDRSYVSQSLSISTWTITQLKYSFTHPIHWTHSSSYTQFKHGSISITWVSITLQTSRLNFRCSLPFLTAKGSLLPRSVRTIAPSPSSLANHWAHGKKYFHLGCRRSVTTTFMNK